MLSEVKEKPILFSTPMVQAILEGRKTQTRRVLKLKKGDTVGRIYDEIETEYTICDKDGDIVPMEFVSPYGVEGDRLWVRETWSPCPENRPVPHPEQCPKVWYKADNNRPTWAEQPWKPSIHMFRKDSRIILPVSDLRIDKLLNISESDAVAEGFKNRSEFLKYWDILNKKRGYGTDKNPFVWIPQWKEYIKQN